MNNTTVDVINDDVRLHHHLSFTQIALFKINHKMSASNDEILLFNAAKTGDVEKVKELLFKGVGTGYRDEVNYLI